MKPELIAKYKKNFQECQKKGSNAHKLAFDPRDSVQVTEIMTGYLCAGSLKQLQDSRAIAAVRCPLCNSIFARAEFEGKLCSTCELCLLGQDSLGLNIKLEGAGESVAEQADVTKTESDPFSGGVTSAAAASDFSLQ